MARQSTFLRPDAGNEASRWCPECRRKVLALPQERDGIFHGTLTVMTCGLWLPFAILAYCITSYRCKHCGTKV